MAWVTFWEEGNQGERKSGNKKMYSGIQKYIDCFQQVENVFKVSEDSFS